MKKFISPVNSKKRLYAYGEKIELKDLIRLTKFAINFKKPISRTSSKF